MSQEEDEHEMSDAERYNDEHIAPKLLAIAEECSANGLSFVAHVEWAGFKGQTTAKYAEGAGITASFENAYLASMTNGNLDAFLMNLVRAHQQGKLDLSRTLLAIWANLEPFKRVAEDPRP